MERTARGLARQARKGIQQKALGGRKRGCTVRSRAATLEVAWMLDPGADVQREEAKLIIHTVQTLSPMYPLTLPSHRPDGGTRQWVFVSRDKDPQTVGEDNDDFFSHSSEPRNPKSRCWQGCTLSTGSGEDPLCVFLASGGSRHPLACSCTP